MTFKPIHKHLLIKGMFSTLPDGFGVTKDSFIKDGYDGPGDIRLAIVTARIFLHDLVELIGMIPVTPPQAAYVHDEGNVGLTGSINLATSHIAFHVWEETGLLMLDVYSCKDFDPIVVLEFLDSLFTFTDVDAEIIDRDHMLMQKVVYSPKGVN